MSIFDAAGDAIAGGIEAGAEAVGQAVDGALDWVADGARAVGADAVVGVLDDLGDRMASATGGQVDERELGETEDPRELIRGDAAAITGVADALGELAVGIGDTGAALARFDTPGWSGDAAEQFREAYAKQPTLWAQGSEAMTTAQGALFDWAAAVTAAQSRAADAIDRWRQAQQNERATIAAYNALDAEQLRHAPPETHGRNSGHKSIQCVPVFSFIPIFIIEHRNFLTSVLPDLNQQLELTVRKELLKSRVGRKLLILFGE